MKASRFIAKFDSASAMLRAVARFLDGKDFPKLGMPRPQHELVPLVNFLPAWLRRHTYIFGGWMETVSPDRLKTLRSEDLSQWIVSHYPRRQYPAIAIGSSGGAAVHLCCALGIPWLPQTLLVPVSKSGIHPDDMGKSMQAAREIAPPLLEANPDLALHHMHDPNQDRLMVRKLFYFRLKRLRLGPTLTEFIEETLAPGGTLILLDCRQTWPTRQVDERHFFQPGAVGGATPEEYLAGSPRVEEFLRRHGSHWSRWSPPEPDGERPEAEWGFEPALEQDVQQLARDRGYRLRKIAFDTPYELSPLVADLYRWWYRQRGIPENRLVGESFILLEPWWTLRTGSVPFWSVFAVEPAAERLEAYLTHSDPYDEIRLMLFPHGVHSVGLAPIARWRELLQHAKVRGEFAGVDERRFPQDFASFVRYHRAMKRIPSRFPLPAPLTLAQFDEFLEQSRAAYAVEWKDFS